MTMPDEPQDDLDSRLREDAYIPDDGFTRQVLQRVSASRRLSPRAVVLGISFTLAGGVLLFQMGASLPFLARVLASFSSPEMVMGWAALLTNPGYLAGLVLLECAFCHAIVQLLTRLESKWG